MQTNNDNTIPPFSFLRPNPVKGYGEFNGYVSLPIGHPWYGKTYPKLQMVDIHYGLTYSEEEDGRWVIGFDTYHASDDQDWNREKVRKEANRLLEQAEDEERWEREQEEERRIELECHEKREEGSHWYQPYTEAVPLDLWELFRAITYEIYGKINHELLMKTVSHHSTRSNKLDAYRIYPERGDGVLTAGSSFKLIVGIRYGMGVGDYDSPFVTNETAALFNLDPLNRDN
jgi:hypothetical protein